MATLFSARLPPLPASSAVPPRRGKQVLSCQSARAGAGADRPEPARAERRQPRRSHTLRALRPPAQHRGRALPPPAPGLDPSGDGTGDRSRQGRDGGQRIPLHSLSEALYAEPAPRGEAPARRGQAAKPAPSPPPPAPRQSAAGIALATGQQTTAGQSGGGGGRGRAAGLRSGQSLKRGRRQRLRGAPVPPALPPPRAAPAWPQTPVAKLLEPAVQRCGKLCGRVITEVVAGDGWEPQVTSLERCARE